MSRYIFEMRCPECKDESLIEDDTPPPIEVCGHCLVELIIVRVTVIGHDALTTQGANTNDDGSHFRNE